MEKMRSPSMLLADLFQINTQLGTTLVERL